jgi:mannose-6-phosphate isomerase-like protein (cupin superfamily)
MDVKTLSELRRFAAEKMVKAGVFATPRLFYDLYCLEPGQAQKVHTHDGSDKVYLVLEGRAAITIGGEEQELGSGQAVLAAAGVPHGARNASAERAVLLVVTTPPPSHG